MSDSGAAGYSAFFSDPPNASAATATAATNANAKTDSADYINATTNQATTSSSSSTATTSTTSTTNEDGSRKRRSRWGGSAADSGSTASYSAACQPPANASTTASAGAPTSSVPVSTVTSSSEDVDENGQPRKKSRWSKPEPNAGLTSAQRALNALTPEQVEQFKIQLRIDELTRQILNPAEALKERETKEASGARARSPSPEPIYDVNGVRTNTRAQRFGKQLERERQELIEALQKSNPAYKPPAGFKKIRYERRLPIPIKEYPDYNFFGMIIGPRGMTQKRMEKESGCRIVIRGRGSSKEGRNGGAPQPGDEEELHVLVSGDNEASVISTAKEVEKLLVPMDDGRNEHKARQLRELAVMNGTLRAEIICRLCGQPGHRQLECPQRNQNWTPANIRCNICGSDLHPSADCPQRFHRTAEEAAKEMNDEYSSFMDELVGDGAGAKRTAQPLALTDGGAASGASGSSSGPPPPPNAAAAAAGAPRPSTSGFVHPDRAHLRGDHGGGGGGDRFHRDGGSRFVKGPGENYREFRPAAAVRDSAHLPAVSHRDGFKDSAAAHHAAPHSHPPPPPPPAAGYHYDPYAQYGPPHGGYGQHHAPWNAASHPPPPPAAYYGAPYGAPPPPPPPGVPGSYDHYPPPPAPPGL